MHQDMMHIGMLSLVADLHTNKLGNYLKEPEKNSRLWRLVADKIFSLAI